VRLSDSRGPSDEIDRLKGATLGYVGRDAQSSGKTRADGTKPRKGRRNHSNLATRIPQVLRRGGSLRQLTGGKNRTDENWS